MQADVFLSYAEEDRARAGAVSNALEALGWSVGLLQGFYQRAFSALGASDTMAVRAVGESTGGIDIHLRFGR